MKKKLLAFSGLLLIFSGQIHSQTSAVWTSRYTSTGNNSDKVAGMVADASGNVYVTGTAWGSGGNFDYLTIKYNSSGVEQWKMAYNGTGNGYDEVRAIKIDASGNVYVTGYSDGGSGNYDYATVKYSSSGVQQWTRRYDASGRLDEAYDIAVDASGNVYVTGSSDAGTTTKTDYAILKYNSAGTQQWVRRYDPGNTEDDKSNAIFVDGSGNVYVTGYSFGTADYDYATVKYNSAGTQQWASRYNHTSALYDAASAIAVDGSGNVFVTGSSNGGASKMDYATIKYNSSGTQQWVKRYDAGNAEDDRSNGILLDGSGNVYVTGVSKGSGTLEDVATIKYNNSGVEQWTARFNDGNYYDEGKSLALDASGNLYIAGFTYRSASNSDYLLLKYNVSGALLWQAKYNGTANTNDQGISVALDSPGNVYISGTSRGTGTGEDYATIKYCQFTANAGPDIAICKGASTTLTASGTGATSYIWTPAANLSSSTVANPVANPTVTTAYVVTITNTSGCTDNDTVIVTVNPLPSPVIAVSKSATFCAGDSAKLTASAAKAKTYSWSTSATTPSITVKNAGNYRVSISDSNGCSGSNQVTVVVNTPQGIAGADVALCSGTGKNISASGGGSYIWRPGEDLSDSTIASPIASPASKTTYTVMITDMNGCKNTDSLSVTVNPLPVADAGLNATICAGTSRTLNGSGGGSYLWNPATGLNDATISNPVASPTVTTKYFLKVTDNNGCTNTDSVVITTKTLPAVNAGLDKTICKGDTITLSATATGTYKWSPSTGLSSTTVLNPKAYPSVATTYVLQVTGSNSCVNSDSVAITVGPLSEPVITRNGFILESSIASAYQWYLYAIAINGATGRTYTPVENGSYTVHVDDLLTGCPDTSAVFEVQFVGIKEIDDMSQVKIYPNPNNGEFTFDIKLAQAGNIKINMATISGQLIFTKEMNLFTTDYRVPINVRENAKGIYYLQVITPHGVINKKIIFE